MAARSRASPSDHIQRHVSAARPNRITKTRESNLVELLDRFYHFPAGQLSQGQSLPIGERGHKNFKRLSPGVFDLDRPTIIIVG
jgi:hypothetical protein